MSPENRVYPNISKSEAEHWEAREITRLQAELYEKDSIERSLQTEIKRLDALVATIVNENNALRASSGKTHAEIVRFEAALKESLYEVVSKAGQVYLTIGEMEFLEKKVFHLTGEIAALKERVKEYTADETQGAEVVKKS
jgi:chromosome segregation ATPase